jgi:hypothetical protein
VSPRNAIMDFMSHPGTPEIRNALSDVVTNRATFFPAADYADGSTRWAVPGMLYEPYQSFNKLMGGQGTAGDALNVAGSAMVGAMPFAVRNALGSAGGKLTQPSGIRAYHGSPHDFDRFSLEHIGKGEGAQAFGHGLYFAESEGVARSYKDALSGSKAYMMPPRNELEGSVQDAISAHLKSLGDNGWDDVANLRHVVRNEIEHGRLDPNGGDAFEAMVRDGRLVDEVNPGRLYEVSIRANPEDFLDWDKPLKGQPAYDRLLRYVEEIKKAGLENEYKDFIESAQMAGMGGEWFMRGASQGLKKNLPELSRELKAAGIPGIRYLDQMSRTEGAGTSNYVVFDDNLIEILRKYGLLGTIGAGAVASSQMPEPQREY